MISAFGKEIHLSAEVNVGKHGQGGCLGRISDGI